MCDKERGFGPFRVSWWFVNYPNHARLPLNEPIYIALQSARQHFIKPRLQIPSSHLISMRPTFTISNLVPSFSCPMINILRPLIDFCKSTISNHNFIPSVFRIACMCFQFFCNQASPKWNVMVFGVIMLLFLLLYLCLSQSLSSYLSRHSRPACMAVCVNFCPNKSSFTHTHTLYISHYKT